MASTVSSFKIGFIGTGIMGKSMCYNIMTKMQTKVMVYNRTRSKIEYLLSNGADEAKSIEDMAEKCNVIITMLGYPKDVESVIMSKVLPSIQPNSFIVDCTTSNPSLAEKIAIAAKERGVVSLDAPVSGGDMGALNGTLSIMIGASDAKKLTKSITSESGEVQEKTEYASDALDTLLPIFQAMGKNIRLMGGPGCGQHTKMGNQIAVASNMIGFIESLYYAHRAGLDVNDFIGVIGAGAAASKCIDLYGARVIKRDFNPGFKVEHFVKDLGICLEETKRMGIVLPGMQLAFQLYSSLLSLNHGELDIHKLASMGNSDSTALLRGLIQVMSEREISDENPIVFDTIWSYPSSQQDVFSVIQPSDVRELRRIQPKNASRLIATAITKLEMISLDASLSAQDNHRTTLNCIRILTRMIPFLLEDLSSSSNNNSNDVNGHSKSDGTSSSLKTAQDKFPNAFFWESNEIHKVPHGKRLLDSIGRLMFLQGFTTSLEPSKDANPDFSILWSNDQSPELDSNRSEVIGLLLACFSQTLYHDLSTTPNVRAPMSDNIWLKSCRQNDNPMPRAHEFCHSILDIAAIYDPSGWGSKIPLFGSGYANEVRQNLLKIGIQVLLVLLDFNESPDPKNIFHQSLLLLGSDSGSVSAKTESTSNENDKSAKSTKSNEELSVETKKRYGVMYEGILRLLLLSTNPKSGAYQSSGNSPSTYHVEVLVLLWKLLDEVPSFRKYILSREDVVKLLHPLTNLMWELRHSKANVGVIYMCTFIFLLLSGEREFGLRLNAHIDPSLVYFTGGPTVTGCNYADLVVIVLHKLVVDGERERLESLFNCFMTIISNISPYIKSFSNVSSTRLLNLFDIFSQPRFLFAAENNHQYISFLLDTFNNIIQYQFEGNSSLVYGIIRDHKLFDRLAALKVPPPPATNEASSANGNHHGFVPTDAWLNSWKQRLPIHTIYRMLDALRPRVEAFCAERDGNVDEHAILTLIKETTLVGLLPVPHPIVVRKYQPNHLTSKWFCTFIWGVIFLSSPNPMWDANSVKLFHVTITRQ